MSEFLIPLKLKYRLRREYTYGAGKRRAGNSGTAKEKRGQVLAPRRKVYRGAV